MSESVSFDETDFDSEFFKILAPESLHYFFLKILRASASLFSFFIFIVIFLQAIISTNTVKYRKWVSIWCILMNSLTVKHFQEWRHNKRSSIWALSFLLLTSLDDRCRRWVLVSLIVSSFNIHSNFIAFRFSFSQSSTSATFKSTRSLTSNFKILIICRAYT